MPATPQCPQPCGDNVDDFCPNRLLLSSLSRGTYNLSAPLTESDGWDIRVLHIDKSDAVNVPFMVRTGPAYHDIVPLNYTVKKGIHLR